MVILSEKEMIEKLMMSEKLIPAHDKTFNLLHYRTLKGILTEEELAQQIEFNEKSYVRRHAESLLKNLRSWAYKKGYR